MPDRRPMTAVARRRAWGELGVRPWTFLALLLAAAAVVLAGVRWREWRHERRVIESGTPVSAEVISIGMGDLARQGSRDETLSVILRYTPPASTSPLDAPGTLPRRPGTTVSLKDTLPVRVDPVRPDYWTERTEPPPLGLAMITPLLCGGVAVACGLIASIARAIVLRAFRSAEPRRATVVSVRQSPLAPFSKLVGVTLDTGPEAIEAAEAVATPTAHTTDRRVRDCYWPNRCGTLHPNQTLAVLAAKRRTFAAAAYDVPTVSVGGSVLG